MWNHVGHKMFCVLLSLTRRIIEDIETGHDHFQVTTLLLIDHFFIHVPSGLQIHYILPQSNQPKITLLLSQHWIYYSLVHIGTTIVQQVLLNRA